jgi:hypothetical protein
LPDAITHHRLHPMDVFDLSLGNHFGMAWLVPAR